ncbi:MULTISPECIES: hypothetical protein [unclassified Bradyrhizobium]
MAPVARRASAQSEERGFVLSAQILRAAMPTKSRKRINVDRPAEVLEALWQQFSLATTLQEIAKHLGAAM